MKIGDTVRSIATRYIGTIVGKEGNWWLVDYGDNPDVQHNRNRDHKRIWGTGEKCLEIVESTQTMLPTWEMIRDIKPGEVWEVQDVEATVHLTKVSNYTCSVLVWESGDCVGEIFVVNEGTLKYSWIKVEPEVLVDFTEAWAAYEDGKSIRSDRNHVYNKADEPHGYADSNMLSPNDIRRKWVVINDNN